MPIAMMSRSTPQIIVFLMLLIYLTGACGSTSGAGEPKVRCKEAERRALLKIKEGIHDDENDFLSSWGSEEEKRECCKWIGIRCDNQSGHVIGLDFSDRSFDQAWRIGNISYSIVSLQYLKYLDLSRILPFEQYPIQSFIGRLGELRYLNLSYTGLRGEIPPQLGNLSNLQVLDLSHNDLYIRKLDWVSHLSSLRILDLSSTDMSLAHDWVHVVNNLPLLTDLKLSYCYLPSLFPSHVSLVNSSKFLAVLDLSDNYEMNSPFQWLFNYSRSLVHLELARCLSNTSIPEAFGSMASLKYLNLSGNDLEGSIPNSFGNMTALTFLHLHSNHLEGSLPETFGNMIALTHLDLNSNHLEGSLPESFGNMIALTYLDLNSNHLEGSVPESFGDMIALTYLDLGSNKLEGSIPQGFGSMASLEYLDLHNNMLEGEIPKSIWKICALRQLHADNNSLSGELRFAESSSRCAHFPLEYLNLDNNRIVGSLPNFTLYPSLKELRLSSNQLNGNTSKSMGQLSKLEFLDLSNNSMADVMSEAHFSKLFNLGYLKLSSNSRLSLNISSDWIPPFQLGWIYLRSCKLGPHFPNWLLTQKECYELDISNTGVSDYIPYNFWNRLPMLRKLNLSNNEIKGTILDEQKSNASDNFEDVDLSSNRFEGSIPLFLLKASTLNLFRNQFSDLNFLCKVGDYPWLTSLDVSYNQLSGQIPNCWSNMSYLQILILANNKLSGKIPVSLGMVKALLVLHLGNNNLIGGLPSSLQNCTSLMIFDVEENKLFGEIPAWIGKSLTDLVFLSLRSNNFTGSMPVELCHLLNLQLLDLSSNDLSESIPNCLGNIIAMKEIGSNHPAIKIPYHSAFQENTDAPLDYYGERLFLVWKGAVRDFKNLGLLRSIDLSSNKLTGEIPREITKLLGLVSLNLSRNNLTGKIPPEIGRLKSLDALDFSSNHLFGQIPSSLSQIERLNTLDLSSNNLSGKIPTGAQLQTRDADAYMDNPDLCGDPLPKKCLDEEAPSIPGGHAVSNDNQEEDEFITEGFYISAAVGFVVAFWEVCGTLIFNKSWRFKHFKMLNNLGDWLFVIVAVHKAKLLRMIGG